MKELLIKAGILVVGDGKRVEDVDILISGEKIAQIDSGISSNSDRPVLDYSDRIVIPGIIDPHAHVCHDGAILDPAVSRSQSDEYLAIRGIQQAEKLLQYGVTTFADAGSRGNVSFAIRRALEDGLSEGPRMLVCGRMITITGGLDPFVGANEADGPDEVRRAAREELARGVDFIKLVATGAISSKGTETISNTQFTQEEMEAAAEEAHNVGKTAHTHAYGENGIKNALFANTDVVVHGHPQTNSTIQLLKERGKYFMPTLVTYYESYIHHDEGKLPEYMIRKERELFPLIEEGFKNAVKQGVKIVAGTDSGMPYTPFGRSSVQELELMVKLGGMSEMEAIVTATGNAAKALGVESQLGTIKPGKSADLLVFKQKKDPLDDISILQQPENVERVIIKGKTVIKR